MSAAAADYVPACSVLITGVNTIAWAISTVVARSAPECWRLCYSDPNCNYLKFWADTSLYAAPSAIVNVECLLLEKRC